MAKMLKDTLKTIEKYKSSSPHYEELLDILEEILILREEYRHNMNEKIFPIDEDLIGKKLSGGLTLVDFSGGKFDLTEPEKYFLALLKIAEKQTPDEARKFAKKIKDGTTDFENLIRDSFTTSSGEETLKELEDESLDLIELFLEECLRPALEILAEKYGKIIAESEWSEGYCPICGREPKIGELRGEGGKRFLFCNQCGLEWNFMRIKCPFCGNEEQQTLAYFTVEEDEKYRVDVCNVCKRYIKTVDFRSIKEEPNLDVEAIATLHLDMLANEEGYM
ncbi:MAG: formate dehydrogenase accessory protein FdhE [Thermodesulfobacteriota bacterium]|nr:formate dehydrogenase accessory protein FdhE [Thermodesulfobacteriota bacterium]